MQRKNNRPSNRNNRNNRGKNQRQSGRGKINIRQCIDKRDSYLNKARDVQNSDRIESEYYRQHADHYQRLINEYNAEQEARRQQDEENDSGTEYENDAEELAAAEDTPKEKKSSGRRKTVKAVKKDDADSDDADGTEDISLALPAAISLENTKQEGTELPQ